jgi:WD40 repeat protein
VAYDAFISYAHASDSGTAIAVRDVLHALAKPWYRLRALSVFLDRSSLAAGESLNRAVENALGSAEFMILLASPEAAHSKWVQHEVAWWVANRTAERMILVIADGDIVWDEPAGDFNWSSTTALPETLRGVFASEPIWVDVRWAKSPHERARDNREFRAAIASVASRLHGRPKEDLIGEDVRQHRKALRVAWGAAGLLAVLALAAIVAAYVAVKQKETAEHQETLATAGTLGARSELLRATRADRLETTALLAAQSLLRNPSSEAMRTARYAIDRLPTVVARIAHTAPVEALEVSDDGRFSASVDRAGTVIVTELAAGSVTMRNAPELPVDPEKQYWGSDRRLVLGPSACCLAIQDHGMSTRSFERPDSTDGVLNLYSVVRGEKVMTLRPATPVTDFRFSPDGAYLLVNYSDGLVEAYRTSDGMLHRRLEHGDVVLGLVFSGDGRYLATASMDKSATIWSWPDGQLVRKLGHVDSVCCVAFSPDGATLATAIGKAQGIRTIEVSAEGLKEEPLRAEELVAAGQAPYRVTLFDFESELSLVPHKPITVLDLEGYVSRLDFSPGGRYVVAVTLDRNIRIWDRNSNFKHRDVQVTEDEPVFAPNMAAVASAHTSKSVQFLPLFSETGGFALEIPAPGMMSEPANVVAFLPDGRSLLTERGFGQLYQIWDLFRGTEVARIVGEVQGAGLRIAGKRHRAVVARGSEVIVLGPSGQQDTVWLDQPAGIRAATIDTARDRTVSVSWDHRMMVSGRDGNQASIEKLDHPFVAVSGMDEASRFVIALDGTRGAPDDSGKFDQQYEKIRRKTFLNLDELNSEVPARPRATILRVLATEGKLRTVAELEHDHRVVDVALSHDGARFASAGPDGVVLWTATRQKPLSRIVPDEKSFRVAFDGVARRLAVRTKTATIVWDLQNSRELARLEATDTVLDVAISPDGRLLACGQAPNSIDIVDVNTGRMLHRLSHAVTIDKLRFEPSGSALLAVDREGEILIWATATGELLVRYDRSAVVRAVTFAADGRTVDIVYENGSVRQNAWQPHDVVAEINRRITRRLTPEEWTRVAGSAAYLPLTAQEKGSGSHLKY